MVLPRKYPCSHYLYNVSVVVLNNSTPDMESSSYQLKLNIFRLQVFRAGVPHKPVVTLLGSEGCSALCVGD